MTPRVRRAALAVAATLLVGATAGCGFTGIDSLPLPGTVGTGSDSYQVRVALPDVGSLRPNAQVKVGDVAVGTVTGLGVSNWHAVATISLGRDVRLPSNTTATVGQNSLLGAFYLELAAPVDPAPTTLEDTGEIPLENGRAYPTTEQVLAATSVVLNGGGLNQLETITRELHRALGGDDGAVGRLIPQLETFAAGLDDQKDDIVRALDGLDALSGQLAAQNEVLGSAVERIGPALRVLNEERQDITATLHSLDELGRTATTLIDRSRDDLVANLRSLTPTLRSLADANRSLIDSLALVATFPFPAGTTPQACAGDYCNMILTLDLTLDAIDRNLLAGTPAEGVPTAVENLLGAADGPAGEALDPLRGPLLGGAAPAPQGPSEPAPTDTPAPPPGAGGDRGLIGSLLGGGR